VPHAEAQHAQVHVSRQDVGQPPVDDAHDHDAPVGVAQLDEVDDAVA
jgi:hypothetical protein